MWQGCMSAPVSTPRRIILQKPKFVENSSLERKSMCRTLPNGKGCMVPPTLFRNSPMIFNRTIDPTRRLFESLFPVESPYTFEGDPHYDWSIYGTDVETDYIPRRFTFQQSDATAIGQLKLLEGSIPVDQIISPAKMCDSSGPLSPALICHPESKVCPRIFKQDQIFRGDCPKIPRRRDLLLEGCTAQFDRPGMTNPFTGHFTPVMRFPPEYFQMRQYLTFKALEASEDMTISSTSEKDISSPYFPAEVKPCPGNRAITKAITKSSPNISNEDLKPCKKQAAFLSTGRPGATYYEPRDVEQLIKLRSKNKWNIVRRKLGEIAKQKIEEIEECEKEEEEKCCNDLNTERRKSPVCERERKSIRSTSIPRRVEEKCKLCHKDDEGNLISNEDTNNTLIRSKSAYYQPPFRKESTQPIKTCRDAPSDHLGHQDASDNKNIPSKYRKQNEIKGSCRKCCQYPPSIDDTKLDCPALGLSRSFSISTPLKVRSDFFESCEDTCPLMDRYKRAHILSLDRWATNPKREFHLNRFDAVPTPPRHSSAPQRKRIPVSRVPCSVAIPGNCNSECWHSDYDCYLKPPPEKVHNNLSVFTEREASQVGKPKTICKIKDRTLPIDCFQCMRSECLKVASDPTPDDTPCIIKDLMQQDKERRKLRPYCSFPGPQTSKKREVPLIVPRYPSSIGRVPYDSMYKGTGKIETQDQRLMRDLAWLRGKVSTLLNSSSGMEFINGKRAESRVGKVPLGQNPRLFALDVCKACLVEEDCNKPRLDIARKKYTIKGLEEATKHVCHSTNVSKTCKNNSYRELKGH